MRQRLLRNRCISRAPWQALLLPLLLVLCRPALAQTPSPLQNWQYSQGWAVARLFGFDPPQWFVLTGAALERGPLSQGGDAYRTRFGPVIEVRHRDDWFFSMGEGLGVNVVKGEHYAAGFAIGYDTGRLERQESIRLRGLPDIPAAPVVRMFGSYAISRRLPLVLHADVRHYIGGASGTEASLGAYMPLPGSSNTTLLFAGPGMTWSDHDHLRRVFGLSAADALSSGYPVFAPHAGVSAVGFGFSASHIIDQRWFLNLDAAVSRLGGDARDSPLTRQDVSHLVAVSIAYRW